MRRTGLRVRSSSGRLSGEPFAHWIRESIRTDKPYDEFVSDPADPVPFSATPGLAQGHTWMVEDQRFCAERPDVLVYRTPPLEQDVRIAGPIFANLRVSTTGTDADWIVKLIDEVPPDGPGAPVDGLEPGYQMLVTGEVMRAKFRDSFEHPEPLVPGEVTQVRFDLRDKKVIAMGGRLHSQKGVGKLLEMMALLKDEFPNLRLLVLGKRDVYDHEFKGQAQELGVHRMVYSTGWLSGEDLQCAYA